MSHRSHFRNAVLAVLMLLTLAISISACSSSSTPSSAGLTGKDKENVLAYVDPIVDNLFAGYNSSDYAKFSKDMNETMKKSVNADYFTKTINGIVFAKIGKYNSRAVDQVIQSTNYVTIVYNAKFEKDDPVVVRLSVDTAEPHLISGLYFDSANLRK
jgi:hypothetical protein